MTPSPRNPDQTRPWRGALNRLLQLLALYGPGADSLRVRLHRLRGVSIGEGTFIGTDTIIETSYPHLVEIGSQVDLGMRVTIIAHQQGEAVDPSKPAVRIEDQAFIGPGSLILPNVTVGQGAVVNAGSVVTRSVAPLTMVQGNPAKPVARCAIPLSRTTSVREFYKRLKPIRDAALRA